MQIKISDIIKIPDLDGNFILNEKSYSNNIVDKLEVVDNFNFTPSLCSLCVLDFNLTIDKEDEFNSFIKQCNKTIISGIIMSESMLLKIKSFKPIVSGLIMRHTPFIIIPDKISLYTAIFSIQNFMTDHYKSKLNKIIEINNKFSYISLKTPDIQLMIDYFKTIIDNPIIIYDEFFNIIVSTDDISDYERIPETEEKNFLKNLYYYKQKIIFSNGTHAKEEYVRILFPITFERRDKAFLAVFEINNKLRDIDYTTLEICATSTLIEMKRRMALKKIEEKHLNDFLYDLIYRTDNKIDEIKRRAEIFNIHENFYYSCIIFDVHFKDNYKLKGNTFEELKDIVLNSIISFMNKSNIQSLVSRFGRSMLILHKTESNSKKSYEEIKKICIQLKDFLIKKHDFIILNVGIGSIINNLKNVTKSYQEATSSLSFGRTIYDENLDFIISYDDSSLLKIFSKVRDNNLLNDIIPESLKILKKYDSETNSDLVSTLSTYLDCNCNAKKASEKMFIHYKTMLYRLEKIMRDFNIDIEDSNSRLQIELGLQILNIKEAHLRTDSMND